MSRFLAKITKSGAGVKILFNPFVPNAPFLYPKFSDVFRG